MIALLLEALEAAAVATGLMAGAKTATDVANSQEKDKAQSTTADSTRECDKCPAIPKVSPIQATVRDDINTQYQLRICGTFTMSSGEGKTIEEFLFQDPRLTNKTEQIKFDGWKPAQCLFLEAKGKYDQFFDKKGELQGGFKGGKSILNQAKSHQTAIDICDGIPECHWHFMQPVSYTYFAKKISKNVSITVFYTP